MGAATRTTLTPDTADTASLILTSGFTLRSGRGWRCNHFGLLDRPRESPGSEGQAHANLKQKSPNFIIMIATLGPVPCAWRASSTNSRTGNGHAQKTDEIRRFHDG